MLVENLRQLFFKESGTSIRARSMIGYACSTHGPLCIRIPERCIGELIQLHAWDRAARKINEYKHSEIVEQAIKDKKDYPDLEERLKVAHYEHDGRLCWASVFHTSPIALSMHLIRLRLLLTARSKVPVKGRVYCHEQPLFRQVGNLGRNKNTNDFFSLRQGVTYLVVRISRAKVGLVGGCRLQRR